MKCPTCGLAISEKRRRCSRCGTPLRPGAEYQNTPRVDSAEQAPDAGNLPVPEWRKEISQKVRAYGERKKYLTTPPDPLKPEHPPEPRIAFAPEEESAPIEPSRSVKRKAEAAIEDRPPASREGMPSHVPPLNRSEIHAADYANYFPDLDQPADSNIAPLLLSRRAGALVVDTVLIILLWFATLWFAAWLYERNWNEYLQSYALRWAGVFLLGHGLYYLYFYKTSRQTPGQVFFSLELRVPGLSTIPLAKILARWFSMILLNLLNLIPLFLGKKFLLLDLLSGTEIRSLR